MKISQTNDYLACSEVAPMCSRQIPDKIISLVSSKWYRVYDILAQGVSFG